MNESMQGSCLCGQVQYRYAVRFKHSTCVTAVSAENRLAARTPPIYSPKPDRSNGYLAKT